MASLADAGVEDLILSPGSRSSPFIVAAAREPRLVCHDVLDERAAAFFALGQARITDRPAVLLCTSGTAAAQYFPAIVEASMARLPLVVLTADRPFELQDCGAPQTIDQTKIYGGQVRHWFDLGMPDESPAALRALRRLVSQAVWYAQWPLPGPVHVNARARKPLEPTAPESSEERGLCAQVTELIERPIVRVTSTRAQVEPSLAQRLAERIRKARSGLIVCGPLPLSDRGARDAVRRLASRSKFHLFAEATSQHRFAPVARDVRICDALDALLSSKRFRARFSPDFILQIGGTPTSRSLEIFLPRNTCERVVVNATSWSEPHASATEVVLAPIAELCDAVTAGLEKNEGGAAESSPFMEEANRAAWQVVDAELEGAKELTEGHVARATVTSLAEDELLVVGNSLPIRHLDDFCPQGLRNVAGVLCQRGANGIDGLIAGAAGAAVKAGAPVTLFLGDVSLLHDLSSLMLAARAAPPMRIVVLQNWGGRIFERLPLAKVADDRVMAHLTTPHRYDLSLAARMFGVEHRRASTVEELHVALDPRAERKTPVLVEAVVPEHGAAQQRERIQDGLERALAAVKA